MKAIFMMVLGIAALCGGCAKVKDGTITKCKHCDKEIMNTVQTRTVAYWDAKNYKISYDIKYCNQCASQEVTNHVHHVCLKCQEEFKTDSVLSRRDEERADKTVRTGFCTNCGGKTIPEITCLICARCEKKVETKSSTRRDTLDFTKKFDGKVEYKDDCVTLRYSDKKLLVEHHLDFVKIIITSPDFFCQSCQALVSREKAAKKIGDALGGLGSAIGQGLSEGFKRNQ